MIRRTDRKFRGNTYHNYFMDRTPGGELERVPGVTTLLGAWPKGDVLVNWAARVIAEFVADNLDAVNALAPMGRDALVANLQGQHRNVRDTAAAKGTQVHQYAADLVAGAQVDVPEDLARRVQGYARWLDEWQVDPIGAEQTVANRQVWYAGTFDLAARPEAGPWAGRAALLDVKSGKRPYGEAALQLGAYACAPILMGPDGTELDMYPIDCTGVVHVTDEGVAVYPTATTPEIIARHFEIFRHVAWVQRQVLYVNGDWDKRIPGVLDTDRPLYVGGDPDAEWAAAV